MKYLMEREKYTEYFSFLILVVSKSTKYPRMGLKAMTKETIAKKETMFSEGTKRTSFMYMNTARSIPLPSPWVVDRIIINMGLDLK